MEPISNDPPFTVSRPVIRQAWRDLTFLHWSFPPQAVRPLVPPGLELDLWEGRAYVALVPFILEDLTLHRAPALPWLSRFAETNVRTYVRDAQGRRGVWFFSLDAARLAAVFGARAAYSLPYFWAQMSVHHDAGRFVYRSRRRFGPPAKAHIAVRPGREVAAPDELESFLTARWRLYALRRGRLLRADVDHPRWPLCRATIETLDESLLTAAGLPAPAGLPLAHFSSGVSVNTCWPQTFPFCA